MEQQIPEISVVIPTRNRGDKVVATLESVFLNKHPNFEVVLVDQSTNQDTAKAIQHFLAEPRFRYIPTETQGAGRARNIGLIRADGALVAYTDDDCTVPSDWLDSICSIFSKHPGIAVLHCNVIPAPHDISAGTIPHHRYHKPKSFHNLHKYIGRIGMAAGMAVRSDPIKKIGGFDENFGPGSLFRSGEDYDLTLRVLVRKWEVYETNEVNVVHYGFRTFEEFRELTKRDWIAIGATQAKILKCSHWGIIPLILYNIFITGLFKPLTNALKMKKPQGFKRIIYFIIGFHEGIKTPVNPELILYIPAKNV